MRWATRKRYGSEEFRIDYLQKEFTARTQDEKAANWKPETGNRPLPLRTLRRSRHEVNQLLHAVAFILSVQMKQHSHPVAGMRGLHLTA